MKNMMLTVSLVLLPWLAQATPERDRSGNGLSFVASVDSLNVSTLLAAGFSSTGSFLTVSRDPDSGDLNSLQWIAPSTGGTIVQAAGAWSIGAVQSDTSFSTWTPFIRGLTNGGEITWQNMEVDLVNGYISAEVSGGNGLGNIGRIQVLSIGQMAQKLTVTPHYPFLCCGPAPSEYELGQFDFKLTGLILTDDGMATLAQGLGIDASTAVGEAALATLTGKSVGTMVLTERYVAPAGTSIPAVPEPSTWILMGLGLLGVAGMTRRQCLPQT